MEIHIARDGQRMGPFPLEEVRRQLAAGTLLPTDLAWTEGAAGWAPLGSLPGVPLEVGSVPPPIQPPTFPGQVSPVMAGTGYGPPQTSGTAIASLIFGILSMTLLFPFFGSIVAVICGHMARSGIRQSGGRLGGDGMAVAGLVMGYLGFGQLVVVVGLLAGLALPAFSMVQLKGKETKSLSNAKQIVTACKLYAIDHSGAYPKNLDELVPDYLPDSSTFVCPLSPTLPLGYDYFGGTDRDPPDKIVLMSKFVDHQGKRIVVFSDTSGAIRIPPKDLPTGH